MQFLAMQYRVHSMAPFIFQFVFFSFPSLQSDSGDIMIYGREVMIIMHILVKSFYHTI